jgi:Tfp pilus assembly protein PilN
MGNPENQVIALRGGAIEWTRLRRARDGWEPEASGRELLPDGGDPLRLIAQPAPEIAASLDAAAHAMSGNHATLVLPGSCAIQRVVVLPTTDPQELAGMVELQIDALSPFPPETVAYAHEVLEVSASSTRVLIAIVQKSIIDLVGSAFHHRKLLISRLTLSTAGWLAVLRRLPAFTQPGRRVVLIAEKQSCDLLVADSGVPVLVRSHALLDGLSQEDFAQDITEEIIASMTALELEHGAESVTDFTVLMGPDAPAGLPESLAANGGWHVKTQPLESLGLLSEGVARQAEDPPAVRLDLVPESWRADEKNRRIKHGLVLASALVFALWVITIGAILILQQLQSRRISGLDAELSTVKPAAQEVRDARRRVQALSLYGDISHSALECLLEITSRMPEGVELNQLTFEKGKAIALSGEAPASQPIYDFKKALDSSSLFHGTELQGPVRSRNRETFRIAVLLQEAAE